MEVKTMYNISVRNTLTALAIICFTYSNILAQVVWTEPTFPSQVDDVTIYFNAAEGNQGLKGFQGDVYAHTGIITNQSSNPSDWKNVQGNWGTDDQNTIMESLGNDIYSISYNITDYYNIQTGQLVEQLAFVFRNVDGSRAGRAVDGSDIFIEVYPPNQGLLLSIDSPNSQKVIFEGDSLLVKFNVNKQAHIKITNNADLVFEGESDYFEDYVYPTNLGVNTLEIIAKEGQDSVTQAIEYLVISKTQNVANAPAGTIDGINYNSDSYIFQIYAPSKKFAFFLCPENEFKIDDQFLMTKTIDASRYWIELPKSMFENGGNMYQYLVDGEIKIADPYSEIVLDPSNDQWVKDEILQEFPDYPIDLTDGIITVFDIENVPYNWQVTNFEKPDKNNLIIYEVLMRDFLADHSYESLLDTLDYLQRLGVNAIELMPINEFEGNQSWGYNPSFHMALDKYYGSRDQLKRVIDEAHSRGIAIILDVVFNHCFSQSPLAQLYWDAANFRPASNNPWLNVTPKHPFNVGYDFNHESPLTKLWTKQVLSYLIDEFNVDGFRFDLSKGFTQTDSGNNSNLMAAYDQSRINILTHYAEHIWSKEDDIYVILEHFADNSEEKVLAEKGMLLWANTTHQLSEAAMGYSSNLSGIDYTKRGMQQASIIPYMESHDEERMRYKIQKWGNANQSYNTKDFEVSMNRILATASVFFTVPGPKMIWQFGELGYDYSINWCVNGNINENCRLDPKPIKWNYYTELGRRYLFNRYSALVHLKTNYPTFSTDDFDFSDQSYLKKVVLNHPEMDAVTIANTSINSDEIIVDFPTTGMWYEYFTGDEIDVVNTPLTMELMPGDYKIFTSKKITPPNGFTTTVQERDIKEFNVFPNIISDENIIYAEFEKQLKIMDVKIVATNGQITNVQFSDNNGYAEFQIPSFLEPGYYCLTMNTSEGLMNSFIVKL